MHHLSRAVLVGSLVVAFGHVVFTQGNQPPKPATAGHAAKAAPTGHAAQLVQEEKIKWSPAPPGFPAGAQFAVLDGDPSKTGGLFVVALKMPDGYTIAPHYHPTDEHVEVIVGTFRAGMGDSIEDARMMAFSPGSYANMPKQAHHYAKAVGATEVHVFGTGPFAITYVNPKDDPRKSTH